MGSSHQPNRITPIERFPTTPRADGRFQKRINGHLYYFGQDGDRAAALLEYDRVKHDLYAGRKPRPTADELATLALKQLANRFTDEKEAQAKAGDISPGHMADYRHAIRRMLKHFGGARLVDDLRPEDFSGFARYLRTVAKLGPYAFNRERACITAMFNHAAENGWLLHGVAFGSGFKKASISTMRGMKKTRLVAGKDVKRLIAAADPQLAAMIWLGVNGGYGATDCSDLLKVDVDLKAKRIHTVRDKRKIIRMVPLWPETVKAIALLLSERADDPHVFRKPDGKLWVQEKESANINAVTKVFAALMDELAIERQTGVSFGALRHTFATFAHDHGDRDGRRRIMGHRFEGMDDIYVDAVFWRRLKKITDHVRSKLFSSRGSGPSKKKPMRAHA